MHNLATSVLALLATVLPLLANHTSAAENSQKQGRKMTATKNRFANITTEMRTFCLGRFLIDVPKTATIVYGPARVPLYLSRIEGQGSNLDVEVKRALKKIEENREYAHGDLVGNDSMLGKVLPGIGQHHKLVFGVGRGSFSDYNVQSFIGLEDDLFVQEYEIDGGGNAYIKAVDLLNDVARSLIRRPNDEIPNEPGICLDGAFLREPSRYMLEEVTLGIRLKDFPDVHMAIEMTKKEIFIESDALEPRMNHAKQAAIKSGMGKWYSQIKFLRSGYRQLGGWHGYEVLVRKPAQKFEGENHEFAFQSHGEPKNPLLPVLQIELHTGVKGNTTGGIKPSITDEEAIFLWDTFIGSIRPRPMAVRP
ncbi:T6SS immunity protein Tli4 family protein [Pseudoduganella sp. HUAS MS19]